MITTNIKLKVLTWQRGYDKNYAQKYLERRQAEWRESKKHFQKIFTKHSIDLKDKVTLDLAAGTGIDLKILSLFHPKSLIWHDKMVAPYKIAKETLKGLTGVTFHQKDLMDLEGYQDDSIDLIMCRDSLYYIGNDYLFFKNIKRILKSGGIFWGRNNTLAFYKKALKKGRVTTIKRLRHQFFDWPVYRLTGLRPFSFMSIDPARLKYLFKKLQFGVIFFEGQEEDDTIEFLIQKTL